ncbi:hypothetical protein JG688_00007767, partial [Phytophthora aleatoria]
RGSLCAVLGQYPAYLALRQLLVDADSETDDNDNDLFYCVIASHRYLPILNAGDWRPERIFRMDLMRARRDLRLRPRLRTLLLHSIEERPVFAREPSKPEQAPVQLQLDFPLSATFGPRNR